MSTTLADLAELVEGLLKGDPQTIISEAATLDVVLPGQITLADHPDRVSQLANSPAAAAIVSEEVVCEDKPTIVVKDVHVAFARVVALFRPALVRERIGISEAAVVSPSAELAEDVDVHPLAVIGEGVVIGRGSTIHAGAKIMPGCRLGSEVEIFPNAVLYENTQVGDRVLIHAGAVIGANGFGYRENQGRHELSAQLGHVEIGNDVEVGACATIDRGTYGPTIIGEGSKLDNLVQVAHNCRLGKHNLICSQVGIAGSTTTGDYVVMAGQVGVRDHVHIGEGAVLCSKAGVSNDVADGEMMLGQPAVPVRRQKLQFAAIAKLPEMRRQFRAMQRQFEALQEQLGDSADEGSHQEESSDQAA